MARQPVYVEWRDPRAALAWDIALLQSVFTRLRRKHALDQVNLDFFSKQQVLDELVAHEGGKLLAMRANLRAFHTRLASLSNVQESVSLDLFRITRVRDPTLSFPLARALLETLASPAIEAADAAACRPPYRSLWCVHNKKLASQSPATDYKVCEPRPRALSAAEKRHLEQVEKWTSERAKALARHVVQSLLRQCVSSNAPRRRTPATAADRLRRDAPLPEPSRAAEPLPSSPKPVSSAARKLMKQRRASIVAQKEVERMTDLRLQILCPGFSDLLPELPDAAPMPHPIEAFIALAESAGKADAASRLWAHYKVQAVLHEVVAAYLVEHPLASNETDHRDAFLACFFTWHKELRTRTLKLLR
ncbi:hypothetical protein ACHHYP_11808 [Achlya hypogyna]|uniref:Uncharacterized protein n=1 Tax=Achlya hypogyna TaxID=1202772 RepID=A0A1V9YID2_ACHHY|nr:hypothetical protein ACHHYP_11808 [Achlya hypogyna]